MYHAIEEVEYGGNPSEMSLSVMEKHGYTYSKICNGYVNMITKEEIFNKEHSVMGGLLFKLIQYVDPNEFDLVDK